MGIHFPVPYGTIHTKPAVHPNIHYSAIFYFRKENKRRILKKNPLKNLRVMNRLNPYDKVMRKAAIEQEQRSKRARDGVVASKRGVSY